MQIDHFSFQHGFANRDSFVLFCVYICLVLVQFICQLFSDVAALQNWRYPANEEAKFLLCNGGTGPEFMNDHVST